MPAHNARRRGDRSGRRMCRLATELKRKLERDVFGARSKRRDLGDAMRPEPVAHPDEELLGCRRSEEHTSELQSRFDLVCRLLLEKKKIEVGLGLAGLVAAKASPWDWTSHTR